MDQSSKGQVRSRYLTQYYYYLWVEAAKEEVKELVVIVVVLLELAVVVSVGSLRLICTMGLYPAVTLQQ
jgi:hypothetical protein